MKWKEFLGELIRFYGDVGRLALAIAVIMQCVMGYVGCFF
jgi:hypothetical protein